MKALKKEINMMDGPKIKADILQLFKITQKLVSEDDILNLKDELRRVKAEVADCTYDVQACKDIVSKTEKVVDTNQKQNVQEQRLLRDRLDQVDQALAGLKKSITMLDAKNQSSAKAAALNQNPALAG